MSKGGAWGLVTLSRGSQESGCPGGPTECPHRAGTETFILLHSGDHRQGERGVPSPAGPLLPIPRALLPCPGGHRLKGLMQPRWRCLCVCLCLHFLSGLQRKRGNVPKGPKRSSLPQSSMEVWDEPSQNKQSPPGSCGCGSSERRSQAGGGGWLGGLSPRSRAGARAAAGSSRSGRCC